MKLLLVEDRADIRVGLVRLLEQHAFVVDAVPDLAEARSALRSFSYDLVLLDRMLPDGDGLRLIDLCNREKRPNRFIVLSALDRIQQRIEGLELGAYDYVVKPFEPAELLARIRVALRHPAGTARQRMTLGNVAYDPESRDFFIAGEPFAMRRREHSLLEALVRRAGRTVPRHVIEEALYGFDLTIGSNALESHISRLRQRLRDAGADIVLETLRGQGYRLRAAASQGGGGAEAPE